MICPQTRMLDVIIKRNGQLPSSLSREQCLDLKGSAGVVWMADEIAKLPAGTLLRLDEDEEDSGDQDDFVFYSAESFDFMVMVAFKSQAGSTIVSIELDFL